MDQGHGHYIQEYFEYIKIHFKNNVYNTTYYNNSIFLVYYLYCIV